MCIRDRVMGARDINTICRRILDYLQ